MTQSNTTAWKPDTHHEMTLTGAINDAVRFRTLVALLFVLAAAAANFIRLLLAPDQTALEVPRGVPLVALAVVFYEAGVLIWLHFGRDHARPLPKWWVYANAAIESAIPTALIVAVASTSEYTMRAAYSGPASHMYAVFLVLSVLHVNIRVTFAAALLAVAGFLGTIVFSASTEDARITPAGTLPRSVEGFSAFLVLCIGAAAALVATRMRRYMMTSASEAELRVRAESELRAANVIQQRLLPTEPLSVPGFEIVGWNRPASETGGDYFDWIALADGRTAVCIADVTGHGLGPAMVTGFCRAYARTSLRIESKLVTAMSRLNQELINDLAAGQFITFASVIVTPGSHQLLTLSAGHGPLLIYRRGTETVTSLAADALPLGIADFDDDIEPVSHEFTDGDVLLLVTDGFFEWADPTGKQFGIDRLRASLEKYANLTAHELIAALLKDVEAHANGTPQPDDLTAVAIRCIGNRES